MGALITKKIVYAVQEAQSLRFPQHWPSSACKHARDVVVVVCVSYSIVGQYYRPDGWQIVLSPPSSVYTPA